MLLGLYELEGHVAVCLLCTTKMYWVSDGFDCWIAKFDLQIKSLFLSQMKQFFCNWKIKLLKCQPIWLSHKFFQSSYSGVKRWAGRMKELGQELGGLKKRWNFWRYKCVGTTNQFRWIHSNNTSQKQELQTRGNWHKCGAQDGFTFYQI